MRFDARYGIESQALEDAVVPTPGFPQLIAAAAK